MRIFRLPAHLNAFRVNVLNISSRFRIPPFSIPVRPRCAVPPCYPLPVSPCLDSSRSPSRFIPLVWRIALVSLGSPFLSPSHLFPSSLLSDRPVAIHAPPAVSWGGAWDGAGRCDPLSPLSLASIRSVSIGMPRSPRTSCRRAGRQAGRAMPMPFAHLCGFRVAGAICIYPFGKSPNIYVSKRDARYGDWGCKQ